MTYGFIVSRFVDQLVSKIVLISYHTRTTLRLIPSSKIHEVLGSVLAPYRNLFVLTSSLKKGYLTD